MTLSDDLRLLGDIQESLIKIGMLNKKGSDLEVVLNNLAELRDIYVKKTLNNSKMLEYGLLESIKTSIPDRKVGISRSIVYESEYYEK